MRRKVLLPEEIAMPAPVIKPVRGKARDIEMFRMWWEGAPVVRIAEYFGIAFQHVYRIRKRDKWEKLRTDYNNRQYRRMASKLKAFTVKVSDSLQKDFEMLSSKLKDGAQLSPSERTHAVMLLDRLLKESRLNDDKPTEITDTSGTVVHEIRLPPGVRRFGIIPPDPKIKHVEHNPDDVEKSKVTVDDLDEPDDMG